MVLSFPEVRTFVKQALAEIINDKFPDATVIAGIATAGIAHAALVADEMQMPNCYVRPEPKKHGMKNQIEGNLPTNSKVVLVEDLISTGKSSLQAVQAVREAGSEVIGLVALFTYGFEDAVTKFKEANVPFYTISNFPVLCQVAVDHGFLNAAKMEEVQAFANNPAGWRK
jgi:orotate phosphoribosyltransferase